MKEQFPKWNNGEFKDPVLGKGHRRGLSTSVGVVSCIVCWALVYSAKAAGWYRGQRKRIASSIKMEKTEKFKC